MQNKSHTIWSFLFPILKPYKWWYLLMIQAPIVHSFLLPLQALCFKMFIDHAQSGQFVDYLGVLMPIVFYILLNTFHSISWRVRDYAYTKSQPFIRGNITLESYKKIQNYSYMFFQNIPSGSITSKIKGILHGYDDIINFITDNATKNLFGVLVSISMCFFIRAEVFIALLIWSAMFFTIMMMLYKKESKIAEVESTYKHKLLGMIADNITNIFTIFAFSKKDKESNKLKSFTESFTVQKDYEGNMMYTKVHAIGALLYLPMLFCMLFYLVHLKLQDLISISDFIFILTSISIMLEAIYSFTFDMARFMRSFEDFKSSFSILQTPQNAIDKPNATDLKVQKGEIVFKDISFAYYDGNNHTLKQLNFIIKAGEKVGIVGHSGAGKSTLIALLLKNFKATNGDILIDGQSIYDVNSDSLRSQIALIPQDTMLFHRSIGENIGYAKENATQTEIETAGKQANIHEFIESLPEKYNTLVGERGIKLSGGQRQRIAIARAILKNAPILILDEATSSLDSQTEKYIQEALTNLIDERSKTVIAIAHRLSTLKHLNRIIVIDGGKIIEEGTHDELLSNDDSLYKKLWDLQAI